jgi:hypothetical protein
MVMFGRFTGIYLSCPEGSKIYKYQLMRKSRSLSSLGLQLFKKL